MSQLEIKHSINNHLISKIMPSFFEEVDGVKIHYERVGTGSQVLLLIPGAIGKSQTNYHISFKFTCN